MLSLNTERSKGTTGDSLELTDVLKNGTLSTLANEDICEKNDSSTSGSRETVGRAKDDTNYPKGAKMFLIVVSLCLAVFLMALDNSVITTAIPKITDDFGSVLDVGWYGSAYLLTTASLQLIFGKIYTFWSIKLVFLSTIAVFELGSLICAVAPSSTAFIVGRAIAGSGSAGIFSGALLIITHTSPLAKRPTYIGLAGGMYGIASVAGPIIGGVLTDNVSWRWCFYINLPLGGVTALAIWLILKDPQRDVPTLQTWMDRIRVLDPIGTLIFLPAMVCLLLTLQWGGSKYSWNDGRIIALLVLSGVLIIAFLLIQLRLQEAATVPPRIFRNRSVWAGCLYGFCTSSAFFLVIYYIPIWFQAIQGVSAIESGIRNLPMMISTILMSIMVGGLVTALGYYTPFMIAAAILSSVGAGLLSTFAVHTSSGKWIGYQILFGIGYSLGSRQPLVAVQAALETKDIPIGTSIIMFLQTLGGMIFVSIGNSIFTNSLVNSLAHNVPSVNPTIITTTGATDIKNIVSAEELPKVLIAYNHALDQAFLAAAAMAALSVFGSVLVPWLSVKQNYHEVDEPVNETTSK
ncbi:hypothetical protein TMatcc_010803 [Talaromyces marneffei ATCC 18224]|uniref:Major facilitator superfamily (MFS) profile domain-containing protein n=1 Tax=Talaromyces marneffei (strain ATCC 18224 / CBS 334.59 / QM 7333) TaxID=441960 RepID=B6QUJ5_TALMQ|nr:conserved hypothetical protein [Talaromyces marneffei ATCC 18224]KAE8548386.1 hypothetical protein EYB25_008764 [Talaromyces marneffei]